jgi:hypothetical protein
MFVSLEIMPDEKRNAWEAILVPEMFRNECGNPRMYLIAKGGRDVPRRTLRAMIYGHQTNSAILSEGFGLSRSWAWR